MSRAKQPPLYNVDIIGQIQICHFKSTWGVKTQNTVMGAAQSTDTVSGSGANPDDVQYGFHVLRVDEHSPAHDAKLVPFFDYIIYVNGVQVV